MSKLTEIKRDYEASKKINVNCTTIPMSWYGYLLALLEEKDTALRFYANEDNYFVDDRRPLTYIEKDLGYLARKALNTSSNNEGEIQRMKPSEEMEEMGMTISMMGAELLSTKRKLERALAALEESQQQLIGKTEELETAYDAFEKLQKEFDQLDKGAAEDYEKLKKLQQEVDGWSTESALWHGQYTEKDRELAEAQQTIARQREALEFLADDSNWSWWNVGTEDETVTWVGGTDPQHAAREALGNKEGSDKS